ncbi:MAG: GNAT family N-acetyltransferase [Alphaproteobacteria bacterium]|nr:GNAT family N-acetyltransferase [Alphaproteobacteria bacterium]
MIDVLPYNSEKRQEWDAFIDASKNGTFMLKRGYVEYHADRFTDFSLMFYKDGKLIAVLPASLHGEEVRSHGGLTYGGIISDRKMTTPEMLDVFDALKAFLAEKGVKKLLYKRVPSVYFTYPSDEDLYVLFRNGATLVRRDISTAVYLPDKIRFSELRRRGVKKAVKSGLEVRPSTDYDGYISLLTEVLSVHHGTKPVHTGAELALLAGHFPDNIKLYCAYRGEEMMAGVLIFDTPQTVHAQYIANSEEGRDIGALDLVTDYLINTYCAGKTYFDFGISTEESGTVLNRGLIGQKEMFGGRGVAYDFYEWNITL